MTPFDMVARAAALGADAAAVEAADQKLSYGELLARVHAVAAALQQIAPDPGTRVGICSYNSLEHLIAFLGVFAAGHVWVPLYPRLGAAELPKLAEFVGTRILFAESEHRELFAGTGARLITLGQGGADSLAALETQGEGRRPQSHSRPRDATQAIKFTGGTTGTPKAVMQPLRAWNTNIVTQILCWGMGPSDRTLIAAPMTHGGGTYLMPALASGGTLVIEDRLKPERLIEVLATREIATVFLAPTAIQMMAELPQARDWTFPGLRNLIYGGGPMRADAVARAQGIFGPCVATTYGQTEAPQIVTCMAADGACARCDLRASVGRETLLTRVAIMGDDGALLPPGEAGEVVVRGDLVMTGYWQQRQETEKALKDGWLHTGDLGQLDERGYLFLKGRERDVIISGGFNVYPGDVEHVLGQHAAIKECAVFGVPDEKWGEAVHAAVELEGMAAPQALIDHVKAALGPVKAPKRIHVYEMLPRNAYGKLQRQALIDKAMNETGKGDE